LAVAGNVTTKNASRIKITTAARDFILSVVCNLKCRKTLFNSEIAATMA
jgi:hypothetical protein